MNPVSRVLVLSESKTSYAQDFFRSLKVPLVIWLFQHSPCRKAQLDTVQFHLVHETLVGDWVLLVGLRGQNGKKVVTPEH